MRGSLCVVWTLQCAACRRRRLCRPLLRGEDASHGQIPKEPRSQIRSFNQETASRMAGTPRIWVHAVSVGEVTAAAPIVASLRSRFSGACIVLSTSTETGQEMARKLVPAASAHIYYPLDIPCVVRKVIDLGKSRCLHSRRDGTLAQFHPDLPGKGDEDRHGERPSLSPLLPPLPRDEILLERGPCLPRCGRCDLGDGCGKARGHRDARRTDPYPRERQVRRSRGPGFPRARTEIAGRLGIAPGEAVLVAGSTHEGEESVILDVYRRLLERRPDFKLILIPRHIERGAACAELVRQAGFSDCITMSEILAGRSRREERVDPRRCHRRAFQDLQPRHRRFLRGEPRSERRAEHPRGRRLGKGRLPWAVHGGFPG